MITSLIKGLAGSTIRNVNGATGWAKSGFSGLARAGGVGFGVYSELMTTGPEYGSGLAITRGVGYSVPYVGAAMMIYDIGKLIGDSAYSFQQAKRRSSFTQGFYDPFGNAATMRQRSQHNLNRGRASLGSEAFLYH